MSDNSDFSLERMAAKLEASPKDITLWLLLARHLDDPEKQKYCYQRVLSLDPDNEFAQKCLQVLSNPLPNQTLFTICPLCGYPNNLSDFQCKRCHTSLDNVTKIRTVSRPVVISSISDLTVPTYSKDTPPKAPSGIEKGLSLAMQYQQRGDKYNARDVLRKILSKDNHNEQAWLLFSEVAEKPEHEIQCLNNVLHINPENLQAKLRLQELEHFEYSKKDQPPISPKYQETQTTVDPNALKEKNSSFEFQQNHYPSILVNLHPKPQPSTSYGLNTPSEVNVLSPLRMPVISKHDGLILSPSEKGSQNILKSNTLLDSSSKNDGASSINNPVGQGSLTTANPNDLAAKRAALANAITAKNFAGKGVIVTSIFFGFVILCGFTSAPQLAAWILLIYFFCALFVIIYQRGQIPALDQTISTLQVEIRDLETQPINLLTTCKVCQREVAKTAPTCPHCGVSLPGLKVQCPNCGSMNVLVGEKGFSASNAIVGAALMGPLGVLGGLSGAKNLEYYCSSCQKRWVP